MTLTQLFETYGRSRYITDKGDGHSYLPTYDQLLASKQDQPIGLFEVGHSAGGALELFDDYFTHPDTKIVGIDQSDNDRYVFYGGAPYRTGRVKTYIKDLKTLNKEWFDEIGLPLDIVIEDSSHQLSDQLFIVNALYPLLRPGGILVVEDVLDPQDRIARFQELALRLGTYCELVDLNPIMYTRDNALIIFKK